MPEHVECSLCRMLFEMYYVIISLENQVLFFESGRFTQVLLY